MLYIQSTNLLILLPFIISFKLVLDIFFKVNTFLNIKVFCADKLRYSGDLKKNFFNSYINLNIIVVFYLLLNIFFFKGYSLEFFYDNLIISNFNLGIIFFIFIINLNVLFLYKSLFLQKINYANDYFFSILNLTLFLPFMFFSNNVYSFIFFLEFLGILVFYKLIVSKTSSLDFFKKKKNFFFSKKYVNMLFYQFWVTFFSTIFLFYFLMSIILMFGTSNWFNLNFLVSINFSVYFFNEYYIIMSSMFFIFFFFIKMGVAPMHLFKVEIYESIPYISILFYTTIYISVFFVYFSYILSNLMNTFFYISAIFITLSVALGFLSFLNLIFNVQFLKSFLAYSTIINILNFIVMLLIVLI